MPYFDNLPLEYGLISGGNVTAHMTAYVAVHVTVHVTAYVPALEC